MGIKASEWVYHHVSAPPDYKMVLVAMADHADDNGLCYPSMSTIGKKAGVHPRTAKRKIKRLIEMGVMSVNRRSGGYNNTTNQYRLHLEAGFDLRDCIKRGGPVLRYPLHRRSSDKLSPLEEGPPPSPDNTAHSEDEYPSSDNLSPLDGGCSDSGDRLSPLNGESVGTVVTDCHHCSSDSSDTGVTISSDRALSPEPSNNHQIFNNYNNNDRHVLNRPNKFGMKLDWEPSPHVYQQLTLRGMTEKFITDQLDGFRTYWVNNGSRHQGGWDAAFMAHVRRQWEYRKANPPKDEDPVERMTDRSWAEGYR